MRKVFVLSFISVVVAAGVLMAAQQPAVPPTPAAPGSVAPAPAPAPAPGPSWAFHVIDGKLAPEPPGPKTVPGSTKTYTPEQIDDLLNPPDWFPEAHAPAPAIVTKGHAGALACGSCHLMNGLGHPESSDLTGLTADYIVQQMADFKNGTRKDYARMNGIAKETNDEEVKAAAAWFAGLTKTRSSRVVEAAMVPRSFVGPGRMRFAQPGGATEPIGARIITLPEDQERARLRDPNSGFVSYAPPGSIARGKALADTGGGKTIACTLCHGPDLKGLGNVPRLTGVHPIYIARQLMLFKNGNRNGPDAALMKGAVAQLTDDDIVALSAYLGSLEP
jgi:cytochrome c553